MLAHLLVTTLLNSEYVGPLGNYGRLKDAVAGWLNRDDLTARIPAFIALAEARMTRLLCDPDQIVSATLTFINGSASLPDDYGQMVAIGSHLTQVTPGEFGNYDTLTGNPRVYTVDGIQLHVLPSTTSAIIPVSYYRSIPPLVSDSGTNWLLTRAPDLYLYGALLQAEFYGWNDERLATIKSAWDEGIAELRIDSERRRWGAAPLAPRIRRN